jgi:hypothetical protein
VIVILPVFEIDFIMALGLEVWLLFRSLAFLTTNINGLSSHWNYNFKSYCV